MKTLIVYDSTYGNTARIAQAIQEATGYVGVALFIVGSGIYIPALAILSFVSTIGSVVWHLMQVRASYRLGWSQQTGAQEA